VLPVFPLSSIHWPSEKRVQLNIIDPAYRRMYDDLLLSGARRFVVPFTRSLPGGRVRYAEMAPEDRRLHAVGSVLHLEDLQEVSEQTGDAVKYVVSHSVQGRARLRRLLNPRALFETDARGNKVDYLRAEVELLEGDGEDPGAGGEPRWGELAELWEELRAISERLEEPQLRREVIRDWAPKASTWELAAAWQELQASSQLHRTRTQALAGAREWLRSRQELGLLPKELPPNLDASQIGMPEELFRAIAGFPDLPAAFWEPLLSVLAAPRPAERGAILALRLARARLSLRGALD